MADAHTRIDNLKVDIRELGDSILDLRAAARVHDSKLEKVMARVVAHDARFDAIDARLDSHGRRFDAIDTRLDSHERRFDGFDAKLTEILSRLPQQPV